MRAPNNQGTIRGQEKEDSVGDTALETLLESGTLRQELSQQYSQAGEQEETQGQFGVSSC